MKSLLLILGLCICLSAWAGEPAGEAHVAGAPAGHAAGTDAQPHPEMPQESSWPRVMGMTILSMFLLAAGVGTLVRLARPEETVAPDHGHDDHAAGDHHDAHGNGHAAGHH